jgi:hypothetical protein
MTLTRDKIIEALDAFVRQRPGLEFANYGDVSAYRSEMRSITKDLHHYRTLRRQVELSGITAEQLLAAFRAYSGRLSITETDDGKVRLNYCTGQYFPTEYRRAACAVMASALWDYKRSECMPTGSRQGADEGAMLYPNPTGKGFVNAGSWLRQSFKRDFGRAIANRWFN